MSAATGKTCIYPGCGRPAAPPHPLGGPQPSFCELEEHNALTAHQERQRLAREGDSGAAHQGQLSSRQTDQHDDNQEVQRGQ